MLTPSAACRYHAYRLLVASVRTAEAREGASFEPSVGEALGSANLMDKWILAAANGLVRFMRAEGGGGARCTRAPPRGPVSGPCS